MLKIEYLQLDDLTPYEKNTRKHTKKDVDSIAKSIQELGMNDPIGIWGPTNIIVEGHGRFEACKHLGLNPVPCLRLDHLTDDERRAYGIAHNATAELSKWDSVTLAEEMAAVDLSGFGFDFSKVDIPKKELTEAEREFRHLYDKARQQDRCANILNLGKGQFYSSNQYGFPDIEPVTELPPIREWIRFDFMMSDKNPEGKAIHFFASDYKFERIWNDPDRYVDKLRKYVCVAAPDFSPYSDMPLIAQMWNHYRKHWVAAYLQAQGVTVIPTIRPARTATPDGHEWWWDGEPTNSIVCVSTMWTAKTDESRAELEQDHSELCAALHPLKVFAYGDPGANLGDNVEYIQKFTEKMWGK